MLIRMKTHYVGPGVEALPGETIDLENHVALAYLRTDQAELVEQPQQHIEAATIEPPRSNMSKPFHPQLKRR